MGTATEQIWPTFSAEHQAEMRRRVAAATAHFEANTVNGLWPEDPDDEGED